MRLSSDNGDFLEVEEAECGSDSHDLLLIVRLLYFGFAGTVDVWVSHHRWLAFTKELAALEAARQGAARLDSISPGELELVVRSIDRAGHMCVEGLIGVSAYHAEASLRFAALQFDPSQILTFAREAQRIGTPR